MTEPGKTIEFILVNLCFYDWGDQGTGLEFFLMPHSFQTGPSSLFPISAFFSFLHFFPFHCCYSTEAQIQAFKHATVPRQLATSFSQNSCVLSILLLCFSVCLPNSYKLKCCFWFGKYDNGLNINPLMTSLYPHYLCFYQNSRLLAGLAASVILIAHCFRNKCQKWIYWRILDNNQGDS